MDVIFYVVTSTNYLYPQAEQQTAFFISYCGFVSNTRISWFHVTFM